DRGGFVQLRGERAKVYVTNSILRNAGNRFILQGNGRAIDARSTAIDTLVVRNCVMHNIVDRIFRSQGGAEPHNYIEFDQNTIFNHGGRHGTFQFGKVITAKITNNIMENPAMGGTTPALTDEQTQPDNEAHKIFTVDTLYPGTNFTFASNNIYYTQDVLDFYAGIDTVSQVAVYSDLIKQSIGGEGTDTYFTEVLELESIPARATFLKYYMDLYANPAADDMQDIVVEDILLQGTSKDFGYLFDFSTFNPCYPGNTMSATASTTGGPIGAASFCMIVNTYSPEENGKLGLSVRPNPVTQEALISYNMVNRGPVRITMHNLMGQMVRTIISSEQGEGEHTISYSDLDQLSQGMYILRLETQEGSQSLKVMITK
ncbi:MAG: T9SS type A sorting domain-containing protein, partial [Bacteroidota bacterium]